MHIFFFLLLSCLQDFMNSSEQKVAFIYSPNYPFFMPGFQYDRNKFTRWTLKKIKSNWMPRNWTVTVFLIFCQLLWCWRQGQSFLVKNNDDLSRFTLNSYYRINTKGELTGVFIWSSSTINLTEHQDVRPWSHRRLLWSMQAEHQIRLCTNSL